MTRLGRFHPNQPHPCPGPTTKGHTRALQMQSQSIINLFTQWQNQKTLVTHPQARNPIRKTSDRTYLPKLQIWRFNSPVSGTSVGLMIRRICSIDCRSGDRPPWQQKIFSSIIAAMGRLKWAVTVVIDTLRDLQWPPSASIHTGKEFNSKLLCKLSL